MTNIILIASALHTNELPTYIPAQWTKELQTNITEQLTEPGNPWYGLTNRYWNTPGVIYFENRHFRPELTKDKWVITEVVLVKRLNFNWNGPRTIEDKELISRSTNHLRLVENWQTVTK